MPAFAVSRTRAVLSDLVAEAQAERRSQVEVAEAIVREDGVGVDEEALGEEPVVVECDVPVVRLLHAGILRAIDSGGGRVAVCRLAHHHVRVEAQAVDVGVAAGRDDAGVGTAVHGDRRHRTREGRDLDEIDRAAGIQGHASGGVGRGDADLRRSRVSNGDEDRVLDDEPGHVRPGDPQFSVRRRDRQRAAGERDDRPGDTVAIGEGDLIGSRGAGD